MTVISVPLWLQGGTYAADDDRALLRALVKAAGVVVAGTDLLVTQNGTPNMSVNVNSGRAFVQRTSATDFYLVENDALFNLTISAADPTNPRRDLIVARVYDAAFSGALNQATVEVVTGTPAGSPVDPTVPSNSYVLARVAVAAAAASVVTANITDLRTCYQPNRPPNAYIAFSATGTLTSAQCQGATGLRVRVQGGGGGGGGVAVMDASHAAAGGGGGGGVYSESLLDVAAVTFPVVVTVGTGGAGGAAGANDGGGGLTSSFGTYVIAPGGNAGGGGTGAVVAGTISNGGGQMSLASTGTGQIRFDGGGGMPGIVIGLNAIAPTTGGHAGCGSPGARHSGSGQASGGGPAGTNGAGGAGAQGVASNGTARAGGAGGNGFVIVELIY